MEKIDKFVYIKINNSCIKKHHNRSIFCQDGKVGSNRNLSPQLDNYCTSSIKLTYVFWNVRAYWKLTTSRVKSQRVHLWFISVIETLSSVPATHTHLLQPHSRQLCTCSRSSLCTVFRSQGQQKGSCSPNLKDTGIHAPITNCRFWAQKCRQGGRVAVAVAYALTVASHYPTGRSDFQDI